MQSFLTTFYKETLLLLNGELSDNGPGGKLAMDVAISPYPSVKYCQFGASPVNHSIQIRLCDEQLNIGELSCR